MELGQPENKLKLLVVMRIARQLEGDYIFLDPEKVVSYERDEISARSSINNFVLANPINAVEKFSVQGEEIDCFIERGVFELEIDERFV